MRSQLRSGISVRIYPDPCAYLADVLSRLTGRIRLVDLPALMPALMPARWAAERAAAAAAHG